MQTSGGTGGLHEVSLSSGLVQRFIIVGRPAAPALGSRVSSASHSGNDARSRRPEPVHEQPALRQQQALADSGGFPRTLPKQKAGIALTVVAPDIANQPVLARFSYGCRLPQ